MDRRYQGVIMQITRYGLPLLVLIFYVTALRGFQYTPDATFLSVQASKQLVDWNATPPGNADTIVEIPQPLWVFFVAAGGLVRVDLMLVAKVFSLFFCSIAVIILYLLAVGILADRLLAFCASMVWAMHGWFLQTAPSGSAIGLGLALSLGALFFLLRNEYALSTMLAALCVLLFWESIVLFAILLVDIMVNSVSKRRGVKVVAMVVLEYVVLVCPWFVYARAEYVSPLPRLLLSAEALPIGTVFRIAVVISLCLLCMGLGILARGALRRTSVLRVHLAPLLWLLWLAGLGIAGGGEFFVLAVPLLTVYAFFGLLRVVRLFRKGHLVYPLALTVTALFLFLQQLALNISVKPALQQQIDETESLMQIASWIRSSTPPGATISAERPGVVSYYSGRGIRRLDTEVRPETDFVVSSGPIPDGYRVAYSPAGQGDGLFTVWEKQ